MGSPSAAARVMPSSPHTLSSVGSSGASWPLESRLATLVSSLRDRLDQRCGVRPTLGEPIRRLPDPAAALRSGAGLESVLEAGVRDVLRRAVRESVAGVLRAALSQPRLGLVWYGQHDVDWVAHYDVCRRVARARFDPADVAQLELWTTLVRSCGWWWPREDVCVVAERPQSIRTEPAPGGASGEFRLHAADGPAVPFPDGWAVWSWHGTRVPSWVVEAPTVERIADEHNVEVRRCAIEHLGWTEFIDQAGLTLVAQAPDPGNPGCGLRLYDLPFEQWGARTRLLLAVNGSVERDGTRRRYGLRVPPWFDDPIDAAGWTYGLTGAQYAQLRRRT